MRDLSSLTNQELKDFFNSFDRILSDADGVIWHILENIPGSTDAVRVLNKMGKNYTLITNNTTRSIDTWYDHISKIGFNIEKNNIVTPILAMVDYLQGKELISKNIFVLGMSPLKDALKEAGFTIIENSPDPIEENFRTLASLSIVDDITVGAVIADVDVNQNWLNLQKAANFLERPDVLFLSGATDLKGPIGLNKYIIGPGHFINILKFMSERKPIAMAKPSLHLNNFIVKKYKIKDKSRVLFIGDSIPEDMGFASNGGYKKLLVLSGLSGRKEIENWTYPEEYKPDFYVDSLKTVYELLQRVFPNQV